MFANQESDLKNRCFSQRKEFIFVICDKGPWKLNNEEETRNYFESICGDTESTQEITDVELHRGNLENRLFKTRKRNFEQN